MPESRLGKLLIGAGTPLFIVAAALDATLRDRHPWIDPFAEAVVFVAVALLVAGWLADRALRRRYPAPPETGSVRPTYSKR